MTPSRAVGAPATAARPAWTERQFERVTGDIKSGRDDGATVRGGYLVGDGAHFAAPAVLTDRHPDRRDRERRCGRRAAEAGLLGDRQDEQADGGQVQ